MKSITASDFVALCKRYFGTSQATAYAAELVFASLDVDSSDVVPIRGIINAFCQGLCESEEHHVELYFELYDVDDDGTLDATEASTTSALPPLVECV